MLKGAGEYGRMPTITSDGIFAISQYAFLSMGLVFFLLHRLSEQIEASAAKLPNGSRCVVVIATEYEGEPRPRLRKHLS
jgi:hypothetical protein